MVVHEALLGSEFWCLWHLDLLFLDVVDKRHIVLLGGKNFLHLDLVEFVLGCLWEY